MFYLILSAHFFLCLVLVGLVLVQQGKGADMGATFGSGGSNTLFGAAGAAPTIVKLTAGVCILFMVTSVLLIRNYDEFVAGLAPIDALQGSVFEGEAPAAASTSEAVTEDEGAGAEVPAGASEAVATDEAAPETAAASPAESAATDSKEAAAPAAANP